ncbi:MAG TPA: hypothetical protein VEL75_18100 [Candidatus Methylomirabilis sp.]|nr:hypothetical protein [Candidatus Methylomirabilis sp.]
MRRAGTLRRLTGFLTGLALLLALATPARAQFDPMTMSLILGGFQLITGAVSAITIGAGMNKNPGIAMPYGTPCGVVDGTPQICWDPHGGGFEGSPDLPTGAKNAPVNEPVASPAPAPDPAMAQGQ